ncbi:putative glucan endo-1,3-beta-glucosidase btgC [Smittium mucronatum]|uniref:glucan endo-1,3-beta-D-glucosidase n=1 Tax=Smittium mucronatum TaxID=133383 RepID=A0A1R0GWI6_9FUNG|nr:putative glucan endo-1,3-beta-glucosidase btgC [Smittium mucronatum]
MAFLKLCIFVILALTFVFALPIPSVSSGSRRLANSRKPLAVTLKPTSPLLNKKRIPQAATAVSAVPATASTYQGGQVFNGMTYSPYNSDGSCPDLATVSTQLTFLSKYTSSIRLYSTDCNQLAFVLQAISQSSLPLKVHAGVWASSGVDRANSEIDTVVSLVSNSAYSGIVADVSVGNEVIYGNLLTESQLISLINSAKSKLASANVSIPVYTTEVDSSMTAGLIAAIDLVQVNLQTMFDATYTSISDSVDSIFTRLDNVKAISNGKTVRIGEVGYCHAGQVGAQVGSPDSQSQYIQAFTCKAKSLGVSYFIFEALDATWKTGSSLAEQSFGIFSRSLVPNISIPSSSQTC